VTNPTDLPNLPIEHQHVPIEHQGLHDFLYGAADEHAVTTAQAELNVDGDRILTLTEWQALAENARVAGVYAVFDTFRQTQYVGYSRNVLTSLKGHLAEHGSDVCAYVRVQVFKFPKREEMESLRANWIAKLAQVPPGNTGAGGVWATTVGEIAQAAMSESEKAAYEQKKLKLRRAMADRALSQELDAVAINNEQIRDAHSEVLSKQFVAAMTADNWSAVIEEQTAETI
jgi:hypothetical protein